MASDDDTFTGGVAGHVRRIAERQAAERQRLEEQARADAAAIKRKAAEFAEALRKELLARHAEAVPPAPAAQPALIASPARVTLS